LAGALLNLGNQLASEELYDEALEPLTEALDRLTDLAEAGGPFGEWLLLAWTSYRDASRSAARPVDPGLRGRVEGALGALTERAGPAAG